MCRAVSFDVPAPAIHSLSFEERYSQLLDAVDYNHPIVVSFMTSTPSSFYNLISAFISK